MEEKISGLWWLSNNPDDAISGDLWLEKGILELNGYFSDGKDIRAGRFNRIRRPSKDIVIYGCSRDHGKKYTLEYYPDPCKYTIHEYMVCSYNVGKIFIGDHLSELDNTCVNGVYVKIPFLYEWVDKSFVRVNNCKNRNVRHLVEISHSREIEIYHGDGFVLNLFIDSVISMGSFPTKKIGITEDCYLNLKSTKNSFSLRDSIRIIKHFERFLIIATGVYLQATEIDFDTHPDSSEKISLYQNNIAEIKKSVYGDMMPFMFEDIEEDIEIILEKWFSDMDKYIDIFNLFSVIRSGSTKILENKYKDVISALEGFVRLSENKLELTLDRVIKIANEKLEDGKRPFDGCDYGNVRTTRNKLSHMAISPKSDSRVLNHEEMFVAYNKLLFLLEYGFLDGLGVKKEILDRFYDKRKAW